MAAPYCDLLREPPSWARERDLLDRFYRTKPIFPHENGEHNFGPSQGGGVQGDRGTTTIPTHFQMLFFRCFSFASSAGPRLPECPVWRVISIHNELVTLNMFFKKFKMNVPPRVRTDYAVDAADDDEAARRRTCCAVGLMY